jgi:hypothetical protein
MTEMRGLYRREETRRSRNESEGSFRGQPDCPPYTEVEVILTLFIKLIGGEINAGEPRPGGCVMEIMPG